MVDAGAGAGAAPPFFPPLFDAGAGVGAVPSFVPPLVDAGAGAAAAPPFAPPLVDAGAGAGAAPAESQRSSPVKPLKSQTGGKNRKSQTEQVTPTEFSLTGNMMPGGNGPGQRGVRGPRADSPVPMKAHGSERQILQTTPQLAGAPALIYPRN